MLNISSAAEFNSTANDESPLGELARRIRAGRQAIDQSIRNALRVALDVGDALIEARAKVSTGSWGHWLKQNCFLSTRSAELYAQLAHHRPEIEDALQRIPDLSLRAAARLIAKPATKKRPPKPPKSELAVVLGGMSDDEVRKQLPAALPFERFLRTLSSSWRAELTRRAGLHTEAGESDRTLTNILRTALSHLTIADAPETSKPVAQSQEVAALNALRAIVRLGVDFHDLTIGIRKAESARGRRRAA